MTGDGWKQVTECMGGLPPDYVFTALRIPSVRLEDGAFLLKKADAERLALLTMSSRGAWDYAAGICAENIRVGQPLPEALRSFAGVVLLDIEQPPRLVRRSRDWTRNLYLLTLLLAAEQRFGLHPSANDATSDGLSAVHAVIEGLRRGGVNVPFDTVKRLRKAHHAQLHEEAQILFDCMNLWGPSAILRRFPGNDAKAVPWIMHQGRGAFRPLQFAPD